jgi:lipopolysaccharide export system protein LptC
MGRGRLLILAVAIAGLSACRTRRAQTGAAAPAERPPELSMHGLTVQSWGQRGLEWEMKAPVGEGFTQRNVIQVSSMTVQLFENGQRSTEITAPRAIMATGDRPKPPEPPKTIEPVPGIRLVPGDMYLDGGVVVVSTEGSRVTTPWVQYHVDEQVIRSSAPVEVVRQDSVTRGTGLEATTDLSSLKIFNQTLTIKGDEEQK